MPKTKKKKKGKKKEKKGSVVKKNAANKVVLTKEQKIQQCISEHIQIIQMMWDLIIGPLTEEQIMIEKVHRNKCKEKNIAYTPKTSISFDKFQSMIQNMTEIATKPEIKRNGKLNIMLDVFEWFDFSGHGTVSYKEFEQRIGEFFYDENDSKPKKKTVAAKKKKTKKTKGKKKGNKSKKKSK